MLKYVMVLLVVVIVVGALVYRGGVKSLYPASGPKTTAQPVSKTEPTPSTSSSKTSPSTPSHTYAQGKVVVAITDATVALDTIQSIILSVNEVSIHHEINGWVTISKTPRSFDLLQLRALGIKQLFGEADVAIGTYNQIRLVVSSVTVTPKNGSATQVAKLPSGDLRINGTLVVAKGETSGIVADFLVDKSLHITGSGKYILAPVLSLETQSGIKNVQKLRDRLELLSGNTTFLTTVGMNEKGELAPNFEFSRNEKLDIVGNEVIRSK